MWNDGTTTTAIFNLLSVSTTTGAHEVRHPSGYNCRMIDNKTWLKDCARFLKKWEVTGQEQNEIERNAILGLHEVDLLYNSTDNCNYISSYTFIRDPKLYFFYSISMPAGVVVRDSSIPFLATGSALTAESLSQ